MRFKNMHKKHGIKLTEGKMEPVLLVQTRVPGGVETWKGKCQLGFTQLVSQQLRHV